MTRCNMLKHSETCSNIPQHTWTRWLRLCGKYSGVATHCSALKHTALHSNIATHCTILLYTAKYRNTLQHSAAYCNTPGWCAWCFATSNRVVLPFVTHCNTLQHTATHCNTLQHTATPCNTLQHSATHPNEVTEVLWQAIGFCNTQVWRCYNTLQQTATHCNSSIL